MNQANDASIISLSEAIIILEVTLSVAMKNGPILITSFCPWRVHQRSNSSDDLIAALYERGRLPADAIWLRQVPVSFALAPIYVTNEIARLRPRLVICCGMAEKRPYLSIERQAKAPLQTLQTPANVSALLAGTLLSDISDDAGSYVCNHLYYSVLKFINDARWETVSLFIHVPVLSCENKGLVLNDFVHIVSKLAAFRENEDAIISLR